MFTPNDDGINDLFTIKNNYPDCAIEKLTIYNRWGTRIYETDDPEHLFWDGKINNMNADAGTYFYQIEGFGFKKTSSVTLIK